MPGGQRSRELADDAAESGRCCLFTNSFKVRPGYQALKKKKTGFLVGIDQLRNSATIERSQRRDLVSAHGARWDKAKGELVAQEANIRRQLDQIRASSAGSKDLAELHDHLRQVTRKMDQHDPNLRAQGRLAIQGR